MDGNKSYFDFLDYLKDPYHVWNFQRYFGVQKVQVVDNRKGAKFQARNIDDVKKKIAKNAENVLNSDTEDYFSSSAGEEEIHTNVIYYRINNAFWYYFFYFGTQLGDETWYSIFFCFWFWNIDGAVGRRLMLVWNLIMYIGQGMKDVVRWDRPSMPPVIQLESKWALEYGMPSTHAMVGLAIPASIIWFTYGRYQYPFLLWASLALIWCVLVSSSRVYLGMHSLADIYVGLAFASILLIFVAPLADISDYFLLSNPLAPFVTITASALAIYYYPGSDRWTPARGDTTVILGSFLGTHLASWSNFQLGILKGPPLPPPYPILWPNYEQYGETLLRMAVGGVILIATRAMSKPLIFYLSCFLVNANPQEIKSQKHEVQNKKKLYVELATKFFVYFAVGFNILFVAPIVFRVMGCERATFHTEV